MTSESLQLVISDLVSQLRNPRTADPEKEAHEVVADLVLAYDRLNRVDTTRQDWTAA